MGKIIGGVVVIVVLVGIFFWWNSKKDAMTGENMAPKDMMDAGKPAETGMVASIKDAMGLGKKMQCTYTSDAGGQSFQSTVVVDGQKFRSTSVVGGITTYALFDGETQYMWTSKDKNGFKMTKACLDEMKTAVADMKSEQPNVPKAEDPQKSFDMAKDVNCTAATGSADLTVPSDITFADQCAMMKQSMDMMKQYKDKMPAGMTMPSGY